MKNRLIAGAALALSAACTAPALAAPPTVEMTWMSIANWYFKIGDKRIVMDGYITRLPESLFIASPVFPKDMYTYTKGPAGVDLGSLRCDAALYHGLACADDVRRGWEEAAGRAAADVAYWDVVAALSTPPDMGWFVGAIAGQGRPDLTREILVERRDAFLADALRRLDNERTD